MADKVDRDTEVLIVGGGVGGLATANALAELGHSVRVLERAPEFGEVGAGLQLAPNATRLLAEWKLLDAVIERGFLPRRLVLRDAVSGDELTHLDLGTEFTRRYRAPYVVVHRSDLHAVLLDACRRSGVDLRTGSEVKRVESEPDSALTFCSDGTVHRSSVVLGVDGLQSTLREAIVADDLVMAPHVAYRGTMPASEAPFAVSRTDVVAWIGADCHLVQYPLRRTELINQVAVFRSAAITRGEEHSPESGELDAAFQGCCAPVRRSLALLWRDRFWPMADRAPASRWTQGRVGLLGDAAHPMLQYLAQGACQALEDAYSLAEHTTRYTFMEGGHSSRPDWPAVLQATCHARYPRTSRVQKSARVWGEIWHMSGTPRLVRNELLSTREPNDYRHVDWLYGV